MATSALADTPPVVTTTVTKNIVESGHVSTGAVCSGQVTVNVTEVFKSTDFGNGVIMYTDHDTGTATFVSDANGMTYTGAFSDFQALQSVPAGSAFSFSDITHFRLKAPDGSSLGLTFVSHATSTPSGDITVNLENLVCSA